METLSGWLPRVLQVAKQPEMKWCKSRTQETEPITTIAVPPLPLQAGNKRLTSAGLNSSIGDGTRDLYEGASRGAEATTVRDKAPVRLVVDDILGVVGVMAR
jgi:hypothetical protein